MRIDFKNLSIFKQTLLLFGGFLLLAIINFVVINNSKNNIATFTHKVLEAERFEVTVSKFIEQATKVVNNDLEAKEHLKALTGNIDQSIENFKFGGQLENTDIIIEPAGDAINLVLSKTDEIWLPIKEKIGVLIYEPYYIDSTFQQAVLVPTYDSLNTTTTEIQTKTTTIKNPEVKEASQYILLNMGTLAARANELEKTIKIEEQNAHNWLSNILYFFLFFNLFCIIAVLVLIKKNIFDVLQNLAHVIAKGDFKNKFNYDKKNEIGVLAKTFNNLVDELSNTTNFVTKIGEGKLDEKIQGFDESNIRVGSLQEALLNMRDQMQRMDAEESERKWTTEGLAKFVDILRSNDDVHSLGDAIISNLVDYTKANQGGIYIINEENTEEKYLELISLYAFNTKKFEHKKYRLGESLVGQTYLEKKTIYLHEIPQNYISITSGLGDTNPKTVLLVPLKIETDIYGVIELASFNEFEEYQIQFVEKLGESIASTIAGVKANQKTKQLLEESQQLTEQMQAQEEEMRQNMEELSATQEEMARKEMAVMAQLEVINSSLGTAEYGLDGEILNANARFYEALGFDHNTIIQSNYYMLHQDSDLFDEIKNGKTFSGWLAKKHKSGNFILLKSSISPILDDNGQIIKIIELILQFEKEPQELANEERNDINEMEVTLRQNLEELTITQEQLNHKLKASEKLMDAFKKIGNVIYFKEDGIITFINENAQRVIGESHQNITTIFEEPLEILKREGDYIHLTINREGTQNIVAAIRSIALAGTNKQIAILWS